MTSCNIGYSSMLANQPTANSLQACAHGEFASTSSIAMRYAKTKIKMNWIDLDEGKIKAEEFFKELALNFPILKNPLNLWDNQENHLKMEEFAKYTNLQIKLCNAHELKKCFDFIEQRLDLMNSELENSFCVSYCETLYSENTKNKLHELIRQMPPKLLRVFEENMNHFKDYFDKMD